MGRDSRVWVRKIKTQKRERETGRGVEREPKRSREKESKGERESQIEGGREGERAK